MICPQCNSSDQVITTQEIKFFDGKKTIVVPDVEYNLCQDCGMDWSSHEQNIRNDKKVQEARNAKVRF